MNMTNALLGPDYVETVPDFLQGILEGLVDGVLILTHQGTCLYENLSARRICCQINQILHQADSIPAPIWHVCRALINSQQWYGDRPVVLESEIVLNRKMIYRIRVRWLKQYRSECPTLLVTMEDCQQSLQNQVRGEVHQYGLTAREAEVWALYRDNFTYKEIASELYITLNTVKRHMKNISAKRRTATSLA